MLHPRLERSTDRDDPVAVIEAANRAYLVAYRRNARLMALMEQVAQIDSDVPRAAAPPGARVRRAQRRGDPRLQQRRPRRSRARSEPRRPRAERDGQPHGLSPVRPGPRNGVPRDARADAHPPVGGRTRNYEGDDDDGLRAQRPLQGTARATARRSWTSTSTRPSRLPGAARAPPATRTSIRR